MARNAFDSVVKNPGTERMEARQRRVDAAILRGKELGLEPGFSESLEAFEDRITVAGMKAKENSGAQGLPVAGYKPTQPQWALDLVNENKVLEERVLRQIEKHSMGSNDHRIIDARGVSIAKTKVQEAFMWLNRAVFQLGRVALPEDAEQDK